MTQGISYPVVVSRCRLMDIQVELLLKHMRDLRLDHVVARDKECRPVLDFLTCHFIPLHILLILTAFLDM